MIKRGKAPKLIFFINDFLSFEFFANFLLALELDILLGAFVGLKYGTYDSIKNIFNSMVSVLCILFYTMVTLIAGRKIFIMNKKKNDKVEEDHKHTLFKKWEFLYEEVNTEISFASYIIAFNIMKDFLFSPFIILGVNSNPTQIFPIILILLVICAFVSYKRPFKNSFANWTLFFNNFSYIIILVLFYIIDSQSTSMTQKERYQKLGFPCVIMICLTLVINLLIGIVTMIDLAKKAWKKRKIEQGNQISGINLKIK